MNFFPDFAPNSRKEWRLLLFQSNLRKQIRKLPKFLKFVRIIHYYSKLFTGVLRKHTPPSELAREEAPRYLKAINFLLEPAKARILALVRSPVAHLYAWRKAGYDISKCVGRSGFSWKVRYRTLLWFSSKWSNFIRLVLCCIDAKFCNEIFVGKLLTRSTRFTCFCTALTSIFQKKFVKLFSHFATNIASITHFRKKSIEFCSEFDEILSEFRKYLIFSKMLKMPKNVDEILLKYWGLSGAKACKSCRSRQELSNVSNR